MECLNSVSARRRSSTGIYSIKGLEITQELLHKLFTYLPSTGKLIRNVRTGYNSRVGEEIGSYNRDGYRKVNLGGRTFLVHRVIWFHQTGRWPVAELDHIDGGRANNRMDNLREATRVENSRSRVANKCSRSGVKGVSKSGAGWQAQIEIGSKYNYLGTFDTIAEAKAAYDTYARQHHGEFFKA